MTVDADLTGAEPVLTVETGTRLLNLLPDSVEVVDGSSVLTFLPTQEETLELFPVKYANVQLRWIIGTSAFASRIERVAIGDVLNEAVMRP